MMLVQGVCKAEIILIWSICAVKLVVWQFTHVLPFPSCDGDWQFDKLRRAGFFWTMMFTDDRCSEMRNI